MLVGLVACVVAACLVAAVGGEPGHCVMYGLCGSTLSLARSNCVSNRTAPLLKDQHSLNTLADICPQLFEHTDGQVSPIHTCCDADTVAQMHMQLQLVSSMLGRCPVCYYNFRQSVCQLACASDQSSFVRITNQTSSGEPYVTALSVYLHGNYTRAVFDSCSQVQNTVTNQPVIGLLCGQWGAFRCNDRRLYYSLGHNAYTPYPIDYVIVNDTSVTDVEEGMEPYNPRVPTCNQNFTTDLGTQVEACTCGDCHSACPVAPPIPPPAGAWMIGPVYGSVVVMAAVFIGGVTVAGMLCACWLPCATGGDNATTAARHASCESFSATEATAAAAGDTHHEANGASIVSHASLMDKWGAIMEQRMQHFFRRWGIFCASHPVPILVVGLAVATGLSFGIVWLQITTNPIELWASPHSRARLEKDYFDSQFGPFYRTQMIIIRARNLSAFNHTNSDGSVQFGPAFNLDLLKAAMRLQNHITEHITADYENSSVRLQDICYRPLAPDNNNCSVFSVSEYFQDSERNLLFSKPDSGAGNDSGVVNYLDHIKYCVLNPTELQDADYNYLPCMSRWGGPTFPFTAVGGFLADGQTLNSGVTYLNSTALLITILVKNHNNATLNGPAMAWEKAYLEYMSQFEHPLMDVAYYAERSVEDELTRESESDTSTVLISYLIMFAYISISLGQYHGSSRLLVDSKVTLGLGGVIIVLLSVLASLGVYGLIGVSGTLIVIEVIPFLVLAVGVDNIFILVQSYQREQMRPTSANEPLANYIGRIVGDTAPSMLLSSFSESACFFLGALISMPAVRAFALFAGLSLLIDFALQITCFISLMTLDAQRQRANRFDIICCVRAASKPESVSGGGGDESTGSRGAGLLYRVFERCYTPLLMRTRVRVAVLVVFFGWLCSSAAVLPYIEVGLDQEISMPQHSYMLKLFEFQQRYLSVGPPVYFVVRDGLDFSERRVQNAVCSTLGCDRLSVGQQISMASQQAARTYIASGATNWLDDFYEWSVFGFDRNGHPNDANACCYEFHSNHSFCPSTMGNSMAFECEQCTHMSYTGRYQRPDAATFSRYLPFFLQDNPSASCPKGGHAAYVDAVRVRNTGAHSSVVGASYFMAYHTILRTSRDYYSALHWARSLASNMTATLRQAVSSPDGETAATAQVEVFPYSVFYLFYEQYLTMWPDVLRALAISIVTVFLVTFFLLGLDLHSAFIILLMIVAILVDLGALMYWWNISLNAVSLVNLVMAVGISVEFCSHITRAFVVSLRPTRVERAADALTNLGSSVLSGITLTKFGGIIVLGFAHSQIFRIFYFRMYLGVVLFGAAHGLILLPVVLSFIGPSLSAYKVWSYQRASCRLLGSSCCSVHDHDHDQASRTARPVVAVSGGATTHDEAQRLTHEVTHHSPSHHQ